MLLLTKFCVSITIYTAILIERNSCHIALGRGGREFQVLLFISDSENIEPQHVVVRVVDAAVNTVSCKFKVITLAYNLVENEQQQHGFLSISGQQHAETQTEGTSHYFDCLENDNKALRSQLQEAKQRVEELEITRAAFEHDDKRVKFYTGLPSFAMLLAVFQLLEGSVQHTSRNVLTKFQELLLTFIRLRLGVPLQDLAYRFNVSIVSCNMGKIQLFAGTRKVIARFLCILFLYF